MRLKEKICLVTGATGIAAATAQLAAQEGARVFIASLKPEDCQTLADQIRSAGGEAEYLAVDLVNPEAAAAAVERCVARFERVDALFNVAGISGRRFGDGPAHECTEAGWDATLDHNAKSTFLMCQAALSQMLKQPLAANGLRGAVLNTSSVLAFAPSPGHFATHAYAASKGAILSLTQSMAAFYAPSKIRVNALAPGMVRTPMSARAQQDPVIQEFAKAKQPLTDGMLSPEAVARAAIFLLSDESLAITGNVLTVDGGWCVTDGAGAA